MRVHQSALKHQIPEADIVHAWTHAISFFDIDPDNDPPKSLAIGPDQAGNLLELLYLQLEDTDLVIHAMALREVFGRFLTGEENE